MNPTPEIRDDLPRPSRILSFLSPGATGTILCALSALFYSLASICLRHMSDLSYDKAFQIAIKETVTVLFVAPWLIQRIARRKSLGTTWKLLGIMLFASVLTQLVGNMGQIHSLSTVGLTRTIPTIFAVMLIAGAVFGRMFLHERISLRSIVAIGILIASILLLQQTAKAETVTVSNLYSQGLGAAALCGFTYAILAVSIRYVSKAGMHPGIVMIVTTGVGTICLGGLGGYRTGFEQLTQISSQHWSVMLASGVFNCLAFFCLTIGLSLIRLTRANILNASQVAITATAGVLLFHEPFGAFLAGGILLTVLGIAMVGRSESEEFPL
jgi:drug/metabolite transporter, DME family